MFERWMPSRPPPQAPDAAEREIAFQSNYRRGGLAAIERVLWIGIASYLILFVDAAIRAEHIVFADHLHRLIALAIVSVSLLAVKFRSTWVIRHYDAYASAMMLLLHGAQAYGHWVCQTEYGPVGSLMVAGTMLIILLGATAVRIDWRYFTVITLLACATNVLIATQLSSAWVVSRVAVYLAVCLGTGVVLIIHAENRERRIYAARWSLQEAHQRQLALRRETDQSRADLQLELDRRQALEARLKVLAHLDQLTSAYNRHAFEAHYSDSPATGPRRPASAGTVLALDLDGFKRVNDRYGHRAGDAVLQAVAAALNGSLSPRDRLYRIGGDEFVVILDDVLEEEDALAAARRLISAVERPIEWNGCSLSISTSIGIDIERGSESIQHRLMRADAALYEAKRAGKACARIAGPSVVLPAQMDEVHSAWSAATGFASVEDETPVTFGSRHEPSTRDQLPRDPLPRNQSSGNTNRSDRL